MLGGGSFVGGALVREALARGWTVTCLSRGLAPLPAGVRTLVADRLDPSAVVRALDGLRPDLVADTWALDPSAVATTARALAGTGCRYGYVSSRSVYDAPGDGADESAALVQASPDAAAMVYAADKRGGELAVERSFEEHLFFRAGAILGPEENYGRGPWWLGRLARGGRVLAPGPADLAWQYVDVRDLATFAWDALAAGRQGPVDVVSPSGFTTTGEFLETCRAVTGSSAALVWADPSWLLEQGVGTWRELPLWVPAGAPQRGLHTSDVSLALAWGLRCRPLVETLADTWASIRAGRTPAEPVVPGVGLDPAKEARLLGLVTKNP